MSELAVVEEKLVSDRAEEQLVTMRVDNQHFGLSILSVQDIVAHHHAGSLGAVRNLRCHELARPDRNRHQPTPHFGQDG